MGEKGCSIKKLRRNPDGTELAKVGKVEVVICSYNCHPDKFADSRIPGYHEESWPDGCINCCFRHHNRELGELEIVCGLTLNDRGYFSAVSPMGKCEKHKKGKSLFP